MYTYLKAAIFTLLILDAVFFTAREEASSALDAIAWLLLLSLFEWETTRDPRPRRDWVVAVIHVTRLTAAMAIVVAAFAFLREQAWVDLANSCLWIAVVALLEIELRYPRLVARMEAGFVTLAGLLYTALAGLVGLWAWRGEWLDAYDALLWILAFVVIEMDVLRFSRRASGESAAGSASRASHRRAGRCRSRASH